MWRSASNYLCQLLPGQPKRWNPLLSVFYLTYRCDFRCPYCCDGENQPYYRKKAKELPASKVLELLSHVRRYCDFVVITGGEPLSHPEAREVFRGLGALRFDGIILTTNGYDLHQHIETICQSIRYLVVSLDSVDAKRADIRYGSGPGTLRRVQENLEAVRPLVNRYGVELTIAAVATPDNLDEIQAVYQYAAERGYRFSLSPQLVGVKAHADLVDNPQYRNLYDFLIAEKRRGAAVQGTIAYLEGMRDFKEFDCRPSTVLALDPTGNVFYPCLERGTIGGNLLSQPDLQLLRAQAIEIHGPEPRCDNRCHSPCALAFALALDAPQGYLMELGHAMAQGVARVLQK